MRHHVVAFDGVGAQHIGHDGGRSALFIDKAAHAFAGRLTFALKKSDAPAVGMVIGTAAALRKPSKTQRQTGWQVAVHSEELAHGYSLHGENPCQAEFQRKNQFQ